MPHRGHDLVMRVKQLGVGARRSCLSIASSAAEEIRFDGRSSRAGRLARRTASLTGGAGASAIT
jgi:hypothetical protein